MERGRCNRDANKGENNFKLHIWSLLVSKDYYNIYKQHSNWRDEFNMDNVLGENLTYFENEYVFYMDGFDNNKGPGNWNTFK